MDMVLVKTLRLCIGISIEDRFIDWPIPDQKPQLLHLNKPLSSEKGHSMACLDVKARRPEKGIIARSEAH